MNTGEVDPTKLSEEGRKELLQYLRFREVYIYLRKSLVISRPIFRLLNSRGVFFENPEWKWKERMGYNRSIS